jgi:hypothetical protein
MAVPSSGQLRLRGDIALEVYGTATGSNISLRAMSNEAGFNAPDGMSEFYGYSSAVAPSVTTNNATSPNETFFTANGNVTSDGEATITERGFYVGTNYVSPTNNTKYTVSGTTGVYSRQITGLNPNTTYYIWAFATNSVGTTYGSRITQATIPAFVPQYVGTYGMQIRTTANTKVNYAPANTMTLYYNRYYKNPNTNSFVAYYSASVGNPASYDPNWSLYGTNGTIGACTNALNRDQGYINGIEISEYAANSECFVYFQTLDYGDVYNFNWGVTTPGDTYLGDANPVRVYVYADNTNSDGQVGGFVEFEHLP